MAIVFYQKDATVYAVHYKESENPLDVRLQRQPEGEILQLA